MPIVATTTGRCTPSPPRATSFYPSATAADLNDGSRESEVRTMSFTGTGIGAEPALAPRVTDAITTGETTPAMRLQILSTEHWSLLASRSLAWNESFSRAGMFLTTLSGAIVALGLVGGATGFGDAFTLFALVILPVVLFIGLATWIRLGASNHHETLCVIGMKRIRAAYLELR